MFWGTLNCLYSALKPDQVEYIEKISSAHHLGKYAKARRLVVNRPPTLTDHPLLSVVWADILESQGLESERSAILRKTLNNYAVWEEMQPVNHRAAFQNFRNLLNLMYAVAEVRSRGKLFASIESVMDSTTQLVRMVSHGLWPTQKFCGILYDRQRVVVIDFPYEQLTQVEVRCVLEYDKLRNICSSVSSEGQRMPTNYLQRTGLQDELEALWTYFESRFDYPTALRIAISSLSTAEAARMHYVAQKIDQLCSRLQEIGTPAGWCLVLCANLDLAEMLLGQGLFVRPSKSLDSRLRLCGDLLKKQELRNRVGSIFRLRLDVAQLKQNLLNEFEGRAVDFLQAASHARREEAYSAAFHYLLLGLRFLDEDDLRTRKPSHIIETAKIRAQLHFLAIRTMKSASLLAFAILDSGDPLIWSGHSNVAVNLVNSFWDSCTEFELPLVQQQLAELGFDVGAIAERNGFQDRCDQTSAYYGNLTPRAETMDWSPLVNHSSKSNWKHLKRAIQSHDAFLMVRRALRILLAWAESDPYEDRLPALLKTEVILSTKYGRLYSLQRTIAGIEQDPIALQVANLAKILFGTPSSPNSTKYWSAAFSPLAKWLRYDCASVSEESRHFMLKLLQKTRLRMVRHVANGSKIDNFWYSLSYEMMYHESLEHLVILKSINGRIRGPTEISETQLQILESASQLCFSEQKQQTDCITDDMLQECTDVIGDELCKSFQRMGDRRGVYEVLRLLGLIACGRYLIFDTIEPELALDACERAESAYHAWRHELSSMLPHRGRTTTEKDQNILFRNHHMLCEQARVVSGEALLVGERAYWSGKMIKFEMLQEQCLAQLFIWTERLEARSLFYTMRDGAQLPRCVIGNNTIGTTHTNNLLAHETELLTKLFRNSKSGNRKERLKVRKELECLHATMRCLPHLRYFMDAREGHVAEPVDIQAMVDHCEENVIVVQYLTIKDLPSEIFITVYRRYRRKIILVVPDLTVGQIEDWIRLGSDARRPTDEHIAPEHGRRSPVVFYSELQSLSALISPLKHITHIGDTVILCPTELLLPIPMHLLELGGQTMAERNTIVYCANLTMLRRCQALAFERRANGRGNVSSTHFMSLVPQRVSVNFPEELSDFAENTVSNSKGLGKDGVYSLMKDQTLVTLEGKLGSDEDSEEYLDLVGTNLETTQFKKITVGRILQSKLQPATLVTMLGRVPSHNEAMPGLSMSLVNAFLFAGATAVVTTLWDVSETDCRMFSTTFFRLLKEEIESPSIPTQAFETINIAAILQQTTKIMKEQDPGRDLQLDPPAWAAFVLHGYWRTPISVFEGMIKHASTLGNLGEKSISNLPPELETLADGIAKMFGDNIALQSIAQGACQEPAISDTDLEQKLSSSFEKFGAVLKSKAYTDTENCAAYVVHHAALKISKIFKHHFDSLEGGMSSRSAHGKVEIMQFQSKSIVHEVQEASAVAAAARNTTERKPDMLSVEQHTTRTEINSKTEAFPADVVCLPVTSATMTELAAFLFSSKAFDDMLKDLRTFLNGPSQFRLELAQSWKRETFQPLPHEFFDCPDVKTTRKTVEKATIMDDLKFALEAYSGEKWDWWPLQTPRRTLESNLTRLHWRCQRSRPAYVDIPGELARAIDEAINNKLFFGIDPMSLARMVNPSNLSDNVVNPTTSSSILNQTIIQPSNLTTSSTPLSPPSRSYGSPGRQNLVGYSHPASGIPPSVSNSSSLYVLFCVPLRRKLPHAQINVSKCRDDDEFFASLRREYRHLRGFWRYTFSPRKFSHCHFIKATRYHFDELERQKKELPVHPDYEYEGKPPPPPPPPPYEPPIGENEWFNRFHRLLVFPKDSVYLRISGNNRRQRVMSRIPKRKREFITRMFTDNEELWGIQAEYCFSFSGIFTYLILIVAGGLTFWIWWLERHPGDWQNAVVPLTTVMAVFFMFSLPLGKEFKDLL